MRPQIVVAHESGWIPAGSSVVDLGCGLGHSAAWLASRGHQVLALDVSRAAIRRARELHDVSGLTLRRADVARPMRGAKRHDVVIDLGCLHQLPDQSLPGYGKNVQRLTRPGSRYLCLFRVRRAEPDTRTVDVRADLVRHVLGHEFELESAALTDMHWSGAASVRPGAEFRFVRALST